MNTYKLLTDSINFSSDSLDVRDIIARFEELETNRDHLEADDIQEMEDLRVLLEGLEGYGGDEQWRGNWYPITLIKDSYFEKYMDEFVAECYELDALKVPAFIKLTIDYDMLKMDYSEIEVDGNTFYYR